MRWHSFGCLNDKCARGRARASIRFHLLRSVGQQHDLVVSFAVFGPLLSGTGHTAHPCAPSFARRWRLARRIGQRPFFVIGGAATI